MRLSQVSRKKIGVIATLFILALMVTTFGACGSSRISNVTDSFVSTMERMDFSGAYKCFWKRADGKSISEQKFISSYLYIVEQLGATQIYIKNPELTEQNGNTVFSYTMVYAKEGEFSIENPVSLYVVKEKSSYYLEYKDEIFLPEFTPGIYNSDGEGEADLGGSKIVRVTVQGNRGEIFTADNTLVATDDYSETILLKVSDRLDVNQSINELIALLGITDDQEITNIRQRYETAKEYGYGTSIVTVKPKGSIEPAFREQLLNIEGVDIDNDSITKQRYYPYGSVYAHVVGYATQATEDDAEYIEENGDASSVYIGRSGIELAYDEYLQPKDGYNINLYAPDGAYVSTIYSKAAENGADIILTIESYLQQKATFSVASRFGEGQTGTSIVMNPDNGYVQAMVSYPTYDPNVFSFPVSEQDYQDMFSESAGSPLFNRATQGLYAPGSTIKPFTITPALENNVVNRYDVFPYTVTNNRWTPPGTWYWEAITRNEAPDGPLDLDMAIRFSDNIYFAWAALEMGEDMLLDHFKRIGLGEAINFDIPVAKSNLINEDDPINYNEDGTITRKLLADMSHGHGNELITPLQLVSMYTAFQNDGDILEPKLVKQIVRYTGEQQYEVLYEAERTVYKENIMQTQTIDTLIYSMKNVVLSGTAQSLQIENYTLAAKTGTALKGDDKNKKIEWLVSWYQDMDESRLVMTLVEGPRTLDTYARHRVSRALLMPYD